MGMMGVYAARRLMDQLTNDDAVSLDQYFGETLSEDQLESIRDFLNEGNDPSQIFQDSPLSEEICQSISAKISIAAANGDITTIEIEAIICDEFGVNNMEELHELLGDNPDDFGNSFGHQVPNVTPDSTSPNGGVPDEHCELKTEGGICYKAPGVM